MAQISFRLDQEALDEIQKLAPSPHTASWVRDLCYRELNYTPTTEQPGPREPLDPPEDDIEKIIVRLYNQGHSYREIANEMNAIGADTKRQGQTWASGTIFAIIKRLATKQGKALYVAK